MSLRTRLALWVGLLVALAIGAGGWIAVDSAERELIDEVDTFLRDRVDRLGAAPLLEQAVGPDRRRGGFGDRARRFGLDALSEDDAITQVVLGDGRVISTGGEPLPVGEAQLAIARGGRDPMIVTVADQGAEYRVITAHVGRDAALMVARDLSEVEGALAGLTRRTVMVGVIGTAVAAMVAWLLASRLSRPVKRLTLAAEHVATTQDFSSPIDVQGNDEVARLARSFNTMLEALDLSRQQQRRLIMDASHELRTPLTSLRTNVDVLRHGGGLGEQDREDALTDVSAELDELTTLVAELVTLATSSRRPDEPAEAVDLADLVDGVAKRARRRSHRDITVSAIAPAEVDGSLSLLERAVANLVDNAVKFAPAGRIEVSVDGRRVAVRDHGPGIAADDRPYVFDRFYRAVATRTEPGSGLGLSIVHDIVQSHGGQVFVEDPPTGAGVILGFTLPDPGFETTH